MRIVHLDSRQVAWPIAAGGAAREAGERTALIVELVTAAGATGRGEAAPLPGMSIDTLDDARCAIELLARRVPFGVAEDARAIARFVAELTPAPAARFALETALMSALAAERGSSLAAVLGELVSAERDGAVVLRDRSIEDRGQVDTAVPGDPALEEHGGSEPVRDRAHAARIDRPVSAERDRSWAERPGDPTWDGRGGAGASSVAAVPIAVVVDDAEQAHRAVSAGARCLKVKVGVTGDLERVRAIAAAAPDARLRIDANRSWPRARVRELLAGFAALPIDFVEEPCARAHELLDTPLPCPIALDESLSSLAPAALATALRSPGLAALILKPTLLGLARCVELAGRARAAGVAAIVTHALEGPIGTAACAELALALGGSHAVGLAHHPGLDAWRVTVPQLGSSMVQAAGGPGLGLDPDQLARALAGLVASRESDGAIAPLVASHQPDGGIAPLVASRKSDGGIAPLVASRESDGAIAPPVASREPGKAIAPLVASREPHAPGHAIAPRARMILVAHPTIDTIAAIHGALDAHRPLALLHAKLPAAELDRQRALVERAALPDDAAVVLFTSGSTGAARGVVLSRAAIDAAAEASAAHLGWRPDDRWLLALSLAHAGGLAIVIRCRAAGRPIVVVAEHDALAAKLAESTIASLVPTQLATLLDDPGWRPPPRLRAVLLGGAAAPPALLETAAARGVPFLTTYGMTETFGQVATAPLEHTGDPEAPLVPLRGVAIAAGTRDAPVAIRIRAPMLATRYLDGAPIAPELVTADLGFVEHGALNVVGRADDMIISGGENVHPQAIEAVLAATPGVRAACVFAIPDPRWGQLVAAAIAVDPSFDRAAAAARWHAALPPHARPRALAIAAALPSSPNGKLDRRAAALLPRDPVRY